MRASESTVGGWRLVVLLSAAISLAACSRDPVEQAKDAPDTPNTLTILAGSELKELESDIVAQARSAGVPVKIVYSGTLDIVDRINSGEHFDAILPPNGAYPSLALTRKVLAKEKLFYSRIGLGVKRSRAHELGWDKTAPTWSEIADAVKANKFHYAMTNPTASNTGMSALFALASSAAKKTEDLAVADVKEDVLKDFLKGQSLTAGSSGWLAEAYVREQERLDGIVNYEAVLMRLNQGNELREPLTLVYPKDGVISADYPLMLLEESKHDAYRKLVNALKNDKFQSGAVAKAYLRPVNPDATPAKELSTVATVELSFPNNLDVINAVLQSYQGELRRPATSIYVLDLSGSMKGDRIEHLREALRLLTGTENGSIAARFAKFQSRERVVFVPFASDVKQVQEFDLGSREQLGATLAQVRSAVEDLHANGGTAIYSALARAYEIAREEQRRAPDRVVSIVLLTDGENNSGMKAEDFDRMVRNTSVGVPIRIFPILFGEGNKGDMQHIAELTSGRTFDGSRESLARVFRELRAYQ